MLSRLSLPLGVLLIAGGLCAAPAPAEQQQSLEIIQFTPPAGWQASDRPGQAAKVLLAPDSTAAQQTLILILLTPAQANLDLRSAFDTVAKQMTQNGKVVESSEVTGTKTRQGFDAMTQTLVAEVAGGQRVYARIVAANVQNRMATFCYLATTRELYDKHQGEMDGLLKSVSFNVAGGGVSGGAAAEPAKAEYDALEKQKQELLKQVAQIEARQRQLAAAGGTGAAAAAAGPATSGIPVGLDDAALAKAAEQFNKDADRRRKPHTILGDVLTLDGKPIPNVTACSISVGGTTIAAERTHYTIEVDKNGHFEMQVPDGLYTLHAQCTVNVNGHRVPVDLMAIDGKPVNADQTSAAGIVKDFRLVLNALRPGEDPNRPDSYYGGVISFFGMPYTPQTGNFSDRHPNAKVRLTFEPLCPRVDGAQAAPFTVESDVREFNSGAKLRRIPLGGYRVSAAIVPADGSAPQAMGISREYGKDYGPSVELYWEQDRSPEYRGEARLFLKE
jgi:hypothetical protein